MSYATRVKKLTELKEVRQDSAHRAASEIDSKELQFIHVRHSFSSGVESEFRRAQKQSYIRLVLFPSLHNSFHITRAIWHCLSIK